MKNENICQQSATSKRHSLWVRDKILRLDLAGELAYQIAKRKESLWKHFCKDVCEQVLSDMGCEPELTDFRKVFDRAFENETKKWKEL